MGSTEIRVRGKNVRVPSMSFNNRTVLVEGTWWRMATIMDEAFLEGEIVEDPEALIGQLRRYRPRADIFAFSQNLPDVAPKHPYHMEWDNVAAVTTVDFKAWWERLPQETRKNVRRAQKRGVRVEVVRPDDRFVEGVVEIYNESPNRQGKAFYHFGKDFGTIKRELLTFPNNSEFIGAYHETELIGFMKLVYLGPVASIVHIVSKNSHADRRPTNALLAQAVELCAGRAVHYLVYGNYTYGQKTNSSLSEFKRRNGFERIMVPRYYIPLTVTGALILRLGAHGGLIGMLPGGVTEALLALRAAAWKGIGLLKQRSRATISAIDSAGP